jgi:hypothetical protein
MMEKGKLSFSLQKYDKTPSDRTEEKGNSILYYFILNFTIFCGKHFKSCSTCTTWNKSTSDVLVSGYI